MKRVGFSGRFAGAFIESKLTPLVILSSILLGLSAAIMGPTLNQLAAHTGSSLSDISILSVT